MCAYRFHILICCLLLATRVHAQDALSRQAPVTAYDTVQTKQLFQPDAKRAGLYSALVPGLGQVYNRQYWKVPIIYAGLGTAAYFIIRNSNEYNRYRKAYVSRLGNNPNARDEFSGILSTQAVKQYQDDAKRYMDLTVLFTCIGYAGQILEAISGAHLRNFDITPDLTMQISPVITPNNTIGVGLVMNF